MTITLAQIPSILLLWAEDLGLTHKLWELPRIQWELQQLLKGSNDPHGFLDSIDKECYNDALPESDVSILSGIRGDRRARLEFCEILTEAVEGAKILQKAAQPQKTIDLTPKTPTITPMKTPLPLTTQLAFIVAGSGAISGVVNGKAFSIQKDFPNYAGVKDAINKRDANLVEKLIDVGKSIGAISKGVCKVKDGVVYYNSKPLANVLTDRILRLMREDFRFDPMLRFLENLMMNPSKAAIDELYLFLEANEIPLTDDGHFLAYKRVDSNYKSKHRNPDGSYEDHSLGKKPSMKREQVDPDRDRTCSRGLHFCSLSYLPSYGSDSNGDKIVIVKVNPADVCAIPSDYKNAKGRAWTYEVIAEHKLGQNVSAFSEPVYSSDGGEFGLKPSGQKYYQLRDNKGKFLKR